MNNNNTLIKASDTHIYDCRIYTCIMWTIENYQQILFSNYKTPNHTVNINSKTSIIYNIYTVHVNHFETSNTLMYIIPRKHFLNFYYELTKVCHNEYPSIKG